MTNSFSQRSEFKLIVQLFYEGKTEVDYLEKFIRQEHKREDVKINKTVMSPNPLYLAKEAISKFNDLKTRKSEIWVVFDDDGRNEEVKEAIDLLKRSKNPIRLAFMKPCIEIWPLLHNGVDNVTTSQQAQSRLKDFMPTYDHSRNPYFDLAKMPKYDEAVKKATAWDTSLNGSPEYESAKFAGIYKLTEKIKEI